MALRITVDIFSGRPNPVITMEGRQARDLLERVKPDRRLTRGEMPAPVPGIQARLSRPDHRADTRHEPHST